jgi:3-oxoacyl-[acyl-carrier protein] reductase
MDLGLAGRGAVVTAASKGLGFAVAESLAAEGARVVICARSADGVARAVEALSSRTGSPVWGVVADVSTAEGIARVTTEAHQRLGAVDILVTNSGGPPAGPVEAHDWGAWQGAVDLLLRSTVELVRGVLPGMKQRRWGRIIHVTSIAAKQPVDNLVLSNSLRGAVHGFARTLANEVAAHGITVNAMLPGYTRTERVEALAAATAARDQLQPGDVIARYEREIPMGRMGEPAEFAALAAFLASERASYITGQSIAVDGGWIRSLL